MDEKSSLPPYSAHPYNDQPRLHRPRTRLTPRRSRFIKFFAITCLAFIALTQYRQLQRSSKISVKLSTEKLTQDLLTCKKLHSKPSDPKGEGRDKNARWIEGGKATLIKNATIWTGEPKKGTSAEAAWKGEGFEWIKGDVLLEKGLIVQVGDIDTKSLSDDTIIYEANGRLLTAGIIDMHSHVGVDSLPELTGNDDTNEMSSPITPYVRSIDGVTPLDRQFEVIKSGGVTTSLILPGSGNNIGGEAFVLKHAHGKGDGREEISARDMLAVSDKEREDELQWRYMKMACGENAKRVYGRVGERGPVSRLGESYVFRKAFEAARNMVVKQDDWCQKAERDGLEYMESYLPQEIEWEALAAVLRGHVHVNTHCYTIPDLEGMVDHSNEFEFPIRAFHHAHQTFLVPEILKRTWGGRPPASALFADNMYYKAEAAVASPHAGKYLHDANLTVTYVSDNPVLNAQHVLFEAAKGYRYGLPYHAALASVTSAPAEELGLGNRIGKVKAGFDGDVVVWDSDPLSVGATPVQVWIDGTAQFEEPFELEKPVEGPMEIDESLQDIVEEPTEMKHVIFTGITTDFHSETSSAVKNTHINAVISQGKLSCLGECTSEIKASAASGVKIVELKNGTITHPFTVAGGTLGLNAIDAESSTSNGASPVIFTRAIDGLQLDNLKLKAGAAYGVTKAISAPAFNGGGSHYGTSVGFSTTAGTTAEKGAIIAEDAAIHYTLDRSVRGDLSYAAAFGGLRTKLLSAIESEEPVVNPWSEYAYLKQVIEGKKTLALTIHSADGIATALRIKSEIEERIPRIATNQPRASIKVTILGASEAHLLAPQLYDANVGILLSPYQSPGESWDKRRALPGAPLTEGTTLDFLLRAGVKVAVGVGEDWEVRDLGLMAGRAWRNGGGVIGEREALKLVGENVWEVLGVADEKEEEDEESGKEFVIWEGSPLDIAGRVKGVGSLGRVSVFV